MLRALVSRSRDITLERRDTICYGHWVLRLVISHTRPGGTICYGHWVLRLVISPTKQGVYELLPALGSTSGDITYETGCTICYGHWFLGLVTLHSREGIRFVTGIGFCVL